MVFFKLKILNIKKSGGEGLFRSKICRVFYIENKSKIIFLIQKTLFRKKTGAAKNARYNKLVTINFYAFL